MTTGSRLRTTLASILAVLLCAACASTSTNSVPEVTHDGLERVAGSRADRAWVKPGVDFSQYTQVGLLDCFVSFQRNWRMSHPNVRTRDMNRIKTTLADEFRNVFTAALESGGFPVVSERDEHVLLIRPALIDLNVSAPQTNTGGRSDSFTSSPGRVTIVLELYDSVSNEILARAIDRREARNVGTMRWATTGTNRAAARKILRRWADMLVTKLQGVHGKTGS
jgi:hypothetical protein